MLIFFENIAASGRHVLTMNTTDGSDINDTEPAAHNVCLNIVRTSLCRDFTAHCEKTISVDVFEQWLHAEVHGTGAFDFHTLLRLHQQAHNRNNYLTRPSYGILPEHHRHHQAYQEYD